MEFFVKVIFGFLGAVGFSLKLSMNPSKLFVAAFGGVLVNALYTIFTFYNDNVFLANLIAALFATAYAEMFARIKKSPATIFLLPAIIPLVPGGFLYYAMSSYVNDDMASASMYTSITIQTALGVSIGIVIVSVLIYQIKRKIPIHHFKKTH